jgi:pSer/pThr/pTyr-binding forkhead associated (FHA) protein
MNTVPGKNTMYHSGVKDHDDKTIGRASDCNLVLEDDSVSRLHAIAQVTPEAHLAVQDSDSRNGTFLHRNGRWVRIRKVILGAQDRIRFGDFEVPIENLLALFGQRVKVHLREGYSVRGKPLVFEEQLQDLPKPKVILENPRRNPMTGDIEENR